MARLLVSMLRSWVYHVTEKSTSAAKWQVERGSAMAKGTIKKLIGGKGFGFILTEDAKELFFHRNDLQGIEFSSLKEGQQVEYETGTGRDGRPQAVKVKLP
jgi:CspA family cold shock protein